MRIIGGKDYYDGAQSFGHDPNTLFLRGHEEISRTEAEKLGLHRAELRGQLQGRGLRGVQGSGYQMAFPTVIVAGHRYQGIRMSSWAEPDQYFWTQKRFEQYLREHELEYQVATRPWRGKPPIPLDDFFQDRPVGDALLNVLLERRWTLVVDNPDVFRSITKEAWPSDPSVWKINQPVLHSMNFVQIRPPHLLFQDIDLWVSNRLSTPEPAVLKVSDEIRALKHGMDHTSFRKPKSKKR